VKKIIFIVLWGIFSATQCLAGILINDGLSREYAVSLGGKVEGKITVVNTADMPMQVKFYQTDYLFSANGEVLYGEPGGMARSNAGWISIRPVQLTVPPKETASVYYTIQVPEKLDLPGTYWSMVMVEPVAGISPENDQKGEFRIQTVIRYGIQIVTDLGAGAKRQIRFLEKKLISEGEKRILQIDIENIGEGWLYPSVWVELYDRNGKSSGRFDLERARIYPGCSIRERADITKVPPGKYKALVVVENEDGYVVGGQYDLEVE
jgi:hypothetical protein